MFAVVYRWKVHPGREEEFVVAWEELTELIKLTRGSLGSRLHRCDDGTWFAYAQWPNKQQWRESNAVTIRVSELRTIMRECSENIHADICGNVISDRLRTTH
jgi:quinol monooxygenase YgiN